MGNDVNGVQRALARAVADRSIDAELIGKAALQIAAVKHPIRGLDVCERGICIDFFITDQEWWRVLQELTVIEGGRLAGIEVFPYGILDPDLFHVRVVQELEALPRARG